MKQQNSNIPNNFSITYLLFGWLVPLVRRDSRWPIFFISYMAITVTSIFGLITYELGAIYLYMHIYIALRYNKMFYDHTKLNNTIQE